MKSRGGATLHSISYFEMCSSRFLHRVDNPILLQIVLTTDEILIQQLL